MKTIIRDDKIIVFLNKREILNLDFNNEEKLEEYFKTLFLKLKKGYEMELNGYYSIDVFPDKNFGMILEIEQEQLDYYNYFNQIDMKINIFKNSSFLYEIGYSFMDERIIEKTICYKKDDKIYLKIEEDLDEITFAKILEYSQIIYGEVIHDIIKYSKKVRI